MIALPTWMYMYCLCAWCLERSKVDIGSLGTRVRLLQAVMWGLGTGLGPLQE